MPENKNQQKFIEVRAYEGNSKWENIIHREFKETTRLNEIRSDFGIDYTRILYSQAYRRLKNKTQVFFNTKHDHICTRIEHVNLVESVSYTIAKEFGLNLELTKAIATGHDIGHAPFGHRGEEILNELSQQYLNKPFWHENNGLRFVDNIELLKNSNNKNKNLNLTYGVRDGIVCHCGEVEDRVLKPRKDFVKLYYFDRITEEPKGKDKVKTITVNKITHEKCIPYTWEGCVVKISDNIAYLGRDIQDAIQLNFVDSTNINQYNKIVREYIGIETVSLTDIVHIFIIDLCKNSNPDDGLLFSDEIYEMYNKLKAKNYELIYRSEKFKYFKQYADVVLNSLFERLYEEYDFVKDYIHYIDYNINTNNILVRDYCKWVIDYCDIEYIDSGSNLKIYSKLENKEIYAQSIIDYISGMTDHYAIKLYNTLLEF